MTYAGFSLLALSMLLDLALVGKVILFIIGCIAIFQAYRLKRLHDRGRVYRMFPLVIQSVLCTVVGLYFLVLSLLVTGKNDMLPSNLITAMRIVAGYSVFGLVALGVTIYFSVISEKHDN
jgi:hypothetical protein